MAEVEAHADIIEVRSRESIPPAFREWKVRWECSPAGSVTPSGLAKARRCSTEVMAASNFCSSKSSFARAHVLHQKTERNLFGDFERALDLIHGLDAAGAVGGRDVDGRSTGASPFVIGIERRVDRIQRNPACSKPVRDFPHVLLAVGIVEMLPRRKNLDRLRTAASQPVQHAGMQPLFYE